MDNRVSHDVIQHRAEVANGHESTEASSSTSKAASRPFVSQAFLITLAYLVRKLAMGT